MSGKKLCMGMIGSFAFASALCAQATTGTVSGSVADSSGARVMGATVRITNVQTGESHAATTGASGDYLFPSVPTGEYVLDAQASGFKREQRSGVKLDVNQNARVDFSLPVGQLNEVVEVKGDAPLVDTRDSQLGGTVDTRRVQELPLDGRNVYDLMSLMPGVSNVSTSLTGNNDANNMNVNGARVRDNNFYLDGAFNNSLFRNGGNQAPNPDAVEEFHLITSNFDAEYGRLPGSVMNVVTRSGGNAFHGTLFEFLRNDALNARNFFQAGVTSLKRNQFGFSFGGPIRKDKTFFFTSYQGLRLRTDNFINSGLTPTAAQRSGDFSALAPAKWPIDPQTGKAFSNGMIPTARLDPVAQKILAAFVPVPNNASGTFSASAPAPVNDDQGVMKIDHQLTGSNKISGTLFLDRSSSTIPFQSSSQVPNWALTSATYTQNNVVVSDDWILAPSVINQARFSYTLNEYITASQNRTSWSDFGSLVTLGALPARPPQIFVNGFWQAGTFGDDDMPQRTFGASEMLSWIKGSHSFKFGGSLLWNHFEETGNWLGAGQIRFNGAFTKNAQADFLLGMANTFRQNNGLNRNFSAKNSSLFVQDDWKILRRLTLNLGVRWELNPPYTSAGGALGTFEAGVRSTRFPSAPLGLLFPGDPGIPDGIAPTIYTNVAPRIGLAYDVFGNGKTAIRVGYGIFYAVGMINLTSNLQNQPFIVDLTLNATANLVNPWASSGGSPYPYTLNPSNPIFSLPLTGNYLGENSGSPYVQQYNLAVQQQIGAQMNIQVAYVGNTSRKLYLQRDANTPTYIPGGSTAANVNARRPYLPGKFSAIYETEAAANASYNSLQATFTRRFARGFSVLANYTFSKSIDILSDDPTGPASVSFTNSNNFATDRAVSNFSTPHVLAVSWIWQAPSFQHWGWVGKQVIGGWQLNGITTAHSGQPINVTSGSDNNLDGNTNDRPDLVGPIPLSGDRSRAATISQFFNTAAFAAPAGLYGTAGRNIVYGPHAVNWNLSAFKQFQIHENHRLQFRGDFFNVFNEVNLGNPNGTLSSPNFGKITSAGAPRILQFGVKYLF
ncbi:MAG: carboxypeptidase-like regulatory domain-containing protein [Acidobacteriota bacterium]|nr:carboxypeptidase-like regulatory domain-containing protein [Acidobacteriota bacterium]